jgi:hypothetical protein
MRFENAKQTTRKGENAMGPNDKPNVRDLEEIISQQYKVIDGYKQLVKKYRNILEDAVGTLSNINGTHPDSLVKEEDIKGEL